MPSVMWLRRDLRIRDNPALLSALADGPTTALFVLDPAIWSGAGSARRAWLAANVLALAERLSLTIRYGDPVDVVPTVSAVAGADAVHIAGGVASNNHGWQWVAGTAAHGPWKSDVGYQGGYPLRIVDHAEERREALERYRAARASITAAGA